MQPKDETPDYLRDEPAQKPAPGYGEQPAPGALRPHGEEVPAPNQSPHADITYQAPSIPHQESPSQEER